MERLQKYLAACGVASRRVAEQLIVSGRVSVNGATVTELGTRIEAGRDRVELDGRPVVADTGRVYIAVNKPTGTVSTTRDPQGRPTVLDLVPRLGRVYPVGRLDADSEGLMLLTNDGELANRLMHPRYGCTKEYWAQVRERPTDEALEQLRAGVELDDGPAAPAQVELLPPRPDRVGHWLKIVLREGRKRQIRRMLAALGCKVLQLRRVRIGSLELGSLPPGRSRPLGRSEVAALRASAGVS
jgi:23S rRNA pseudouridine2605 synthase